MAMITFEAKRLPNGQIEIPAELAVELPSDTTLQVMLQWSGSDEDEDAAWREMCARSLAAAYAPEDDVYEQLLNEPPSR